MKKFLGFLLSAAMCLTCLPTTAFAEPAEADKAGESRLVEEASYEIYLPADYRADQSYPTVYLMPYDGYSYQKYLDDGIQAKLDEIMSGEDALDMLVVMPTYAEGSDYTATLSDLISDVESKYSAIKDSDYRAIAGVNVGGYMAFETALIEDNGETQLFSAAASHMGDFTSEKNPYLSKGSILDAVNDLDNTTMDKGYSTLGKHFYYLDAPNGDAFTTTAGGTTEIGAAMEKRTNPYWKWGGMYYLYSTPDLSMVEYNVLDGSSDADFYLGGLERSLHSFSCRFTESLYSSSLSCTPQAVTSSNDTMTATVKFNWKASVPFAATLPDISLKLRMTDPDSGEVLYETSAVMTGLTAGEEAVSTFTLKRSDMAAGTNTTLSVTGSFLGFSQELGSLSLVRVQDTGEADDEQQIDLMGDWYFKAYKEYKRNDTSVDPLDKIENITPSEYTSWGVVQPALGWWTNDFDSSLGGNGNYGGYAWYVRTFDLPENFPTEGLILAVGYFDEANEVYVNGKLVGSTGMNYTDDGIGVYDGSNPWDTNCVYNLDSSILNYGGTNTIAVRMCNSSGGGGWYEGPIGLYSVAAYNKAAGKPSTYAPDDAKSSVLALADTWQTAVEKEDLTAYAKALSSEYFESGYTKDRQLEKISGWMDSYDNIQITDTGVGVFLDGDLYNYQAQRTITGVDAQGETQEIYSGEVSEYYAIEDGNAILYGSHSRFFLDTYTSESLKDTEYGSEDQTYRIYLPEGYFDNGNTKRYQTLYLFHGINSTSKTYEIDDIDQVLDEAIASGKLDEMIVVIPDDPTRSSFWRGAYADMVTEDLIPVIDSRYRTINDERYRFTAGCSMGGAGAFNIGLFNPNLFSGVISFYGALNYVGAVEKASALSAEYLNQYSIWMACGNEDMYNFYDVQEQMSCTLFTKGVEHYHYVGEGTHSNTFYLPKFVQAVQYTQERMYRTETSADILSGSASAKTADDKATVSYNLDISKDISSYTNTLVNSEYTEDTTPDLQIPIEIVVTQNGKRVADITRYYSTRKDLSLNDTVDIDTADLDLTKDYTVSVYASVLENTKLIQEMTVSAQSTTDPSENPDPGTKDPSENPDPTATPDPAVTPNPTPSADPAAANPAPTAKKAAKTNDTKSDKTAKAPKTNDTSALGLYAALLLAGSAAAITLGVRRKKKNP